MKKLIRKLNDKGAAAIEFAFIAPIVFLLLLGIIEFGLTTFLDANLQHALRMAARGCMVESCDELKVRQKMEAYMGGFYRDAPDMILSFRSADKIVNDSPAPGGLFPPGISGVMSDPKSLFTSVQPYPASPGGKVIIYGVQYKWGGFTGLMAPFIPDNLYAITIVRNEFK